MFYFEGKSYLKDGRRFSFNPGYVRLMFIFLKKHEDEGESSKCRKGSNVQLPSYLQILVNLLDGLSGIWSKTRQFKSQGTSACRLAEAGFSLLNCLNKGREK